MDKNYIDISVHILIEHLDMYWYAVEVAGQFQTIKRNESKSHTIQMMTPRYMSEVNLYNACI